MEYACGGDLAKYISSAQAAKIFKNATLKLQWTKRVVLKLIEALTEIHEMGFVYRDLKPSNVVISHDGSLKLCDYGLVGKIDSIDDSFCGTPEYMSPERLTDKRKKFALEGSVDAWSLGVFTF